VSAFSSSTNFPTYHVFIKKYTLNFSNWLPKTSVNESKQNHVLILPYRTTKEEKKRSPLQTCKVMLLVQLQGYKITNSVLTLQWASNISRTATRGCFSSSPLAIPLNIWQVSPGNKQKRRCSPHECRIQLSAFGPERNKKLDVRVSISIQESSLGGVWLGLR